jgi:hypothetical protein
VKVCNLCINDTQRNNALHFDECSVLLIIMLNVVLLSAVILNVVMLSVVAACSDIF